MKSVVFDQNLGNQQIIAIDPVITFKVSSLIYAHSQPSYIEQAQREHVRWRKREYSSQLKIKAESLKQRFFKRYAWDRTSAFFPRVTEHPSFDCLDCAVSEHLSVLIRRFAILAIR